MDNIKYDQTVFGNKKHVNLNTIRLSGRTQTKRSHIVLFFSYGMSRNGKLIETEIRLVVQKLRGGAASPSQPPPRSLLYGKKVWWAAFSSPSLASVSL